MRKLLHCLITLTLVLSASIVVADPAPIVFFDIAGPDVVRLRSFYTDVFGWEIGGNNAIPKTSAGIDGTLRQDPKDKVIYLGVSDITAVLNAVITAGGTVKTPRTEVPGVVILALFRDPAGNEMGLIEMADGKAKVPEVKK